VELESLSIDFKFSIINYIEKYAFIPYGKLLGYATIAIGFSKIIG
jgi:hypothetical protein